MPAAASIVDVDRYPMDPLSSPGRRLVEHCRTQLLEAGACELPGFLTPSAARTMAEEGAAIADRAHHHSGASTPYLEIPPTDLPDDHPRRTVHPFALGAVAWDDIPESHLLRQLYLWNPLLEFLAATLGQERLHRYADPLGACNVAVMDDQDELEWHFDQADFVVSIALQSADAGGDFLYAPRIRTEHEENYEDVAALLAGDHSRVRRIPMEPGTLLLFHGRHSIHCVTPVRGQTTRLVALLAYDTKPGTCATPFLQQARYGRVLQPA
jgi:hypothetical protein